MEFHFYEQIYLEISRKTSLRHRRMEIPGQARNDYDGARNDYDGVRGNLQVKKEGLDAGKEEVVPLGVEVGHVVGALEVDATDALEADVDSAMHHRVEDGNAIFFADFFHCLSRFFVHRLRDVPRGHETDLGGWIFLTQAGAEDVELGAEELCPFSVTVHQDGVVVPADDDDIVRRVGQVGIALVQGRAELLRFPLVGDATAVPSPVVVLHIVLDGQFVVPGLLNGVGGVLDVAITEHYDSFFVKWREENFFWRIINALRQPDELLLRKGIQRQQ